MSQAWEKNPNQPSLAYYMMDDESFRREYRELHKNNKNCGCNRVFYGRLKTLGEYINIPIQYRERKIRRILHNCIKILIDNGVLYEESGPIYQNDFINLYRKYNSTIEHILNKKQ